MAVCAVKQLPSPKINSLEQLPISMNQEQNKKIFSTGDCFLLLHNKNIECNANIRGMINFEYNHTLTQKGLTTSLIPGGEDTEQLGMDQITCIVRPDLYYRAYQKILCNFISLTSCELKIFTSNFFDLLHQENISHGVNIRGLINQRYNQLLCEMNGYEQRIPGDNDLESLGMDQTTPLRADLYLQAYGEILAFFEKSPAKNSQSQDVTSISNWAQWDKEKHFQKDDIASLAKRHLGIRHVSTSNQAWLEWAEGVKDGCSFNLTFQKSEHENETGFETLPEEIANPNLTDEHKLERIKKYEEAVSNHIRTSMNYDCGNVVLGKTRVKDICACFQETSFLFVEYDYNLPTDFHLWNGLGRFPKSRIPKEKIRGLLTWFQPSKIAPINLDERIESEGQFKSLMNRIHEWYRIEVINHLRTRVYTWDENQNLH